MDASGGEVRRPQWAVGETSRSWVAAGIASALSFIGITALVLTVEDARANIAPIGIILTWALFAATHAALTAWVFLGTDREQLVAILRRSWLKRDKPSRSDDAPGWAVQLSLMSFIVIVLLIAIPALRSNPLTLILGLVMVIAVWVSVVLMYAVHYARRDLRGEESGEAVFAFPGTAERGFSDYLYLASIVQATFGPPDVSVRTSGTRRTVTVHAVIAFVFNTVIVAVIISLLIATG